MDRPSSQSWRFEYIAAVTRKMSKTLTATENPGTQGGRAALGRVSQTEEQSVHVRYAPSEQVLDNASMSCRHWLGGILILILFDGSTETKGLDVRHRP